VRKRTNDALLASPRLNWERSAKLPLRALPTDGFLDLIKRSGRLLCEYKPPFYNSEWVIEALQVNKKMHATKSDL
jgi:hypothetical protein